MRISRIEPFILHIPVTGGSIADSTHRISHWGVVGVKIVTEDGLEGYGFTGTHADLASDRLITAASGLLCAAADRRGCRRPHAALAQARAPPALQWVGRAGITHLALAAVDIALWDLKAKAADAAVESAGRPGQAQRLEAYNTDIGWLSIPKDELVAGPACRSSATVSPASRSRSAMPIRHDIDRLEAVRRAVGPSVTMAIDGNGKWDLPTCLRFCARAEPLDIFWFEEPLWYDDVGEPRGAGALDLDPRRARRAALYARRLRSFSRPRRSITCSRT
jgi:L-alanine-DL-glutamate epimerase-like enolase superfamily enzyme